MNLQTVGGRSPARNGVKQPFISNLWGVRGAILFTTHSLWKYMKYKCGLPPKFRGNKYYEYLRSDRWKKKAKRYKEKFPICEVCRKNKSVNVHHTNYTCVNKERYWDLIALCRKCHKEKHGLSR